MAVTVLTALALYTHVGGVALGGPMNLAEHIDQLLQLASADPQTTTRDLAILNLVVELAQAVHLAELLSADPKTSLVDPAIINTLAKHIVHLRQLASADPELSLLDVAIINVLAELAEAVEELRANDPSSGQGSV